MFSRIAGTGSYLPEKILTNAELAQMVDTSDEWIRSRTGIERRHVVVPARLRRTSRNTPRDVRCRMPASTQEISISSAWEPRRPIWFFPTSARCFRIVSASATPARHSASKRRAPASFTHSASPTSSCDWAMQSARWSWEQRHSRASPTGATADLRAVRRRRRRRGPQAIAGAGHHQYALAFDGRYKDLLIYPDGVSKGFDLVRKGAISACR